MYVHIGNHRSGSVFLEKKIFKNLKDVNYIDIRAEHISYYKYFLKLGESEMTEKDFELFKNFLKEKATKERNLISYEGFSGVNFRSLRKNSTDQIFKDLKKAVEDFNFKIILVLREQSSFITSHYKRYICRGGYSNISNFVKNEIDLPNHNYYNLVKKLEEVFGTDNIYILLFENFPNYDPTGIKTKTIRALLDFIGEKEMPKNYIQLNSNSKLSKLKNRIVNKGYEKLQISISRFINPLFRSDFNSKGIIPVLPIPSFSGWRFEFIPKILLMNRFFEIISKKYEMPKELQCEIKSYYLKSNTQLDKEYHLKLPETYLKN